MWPPGVSRASNIAGRRTFLDSDLRLVTGNRIFQTKTSANEPQIHSRAGGVDERTRSTCGSRACGARRGSARAACAPTRAGDLFFRLDHCAQLCIFRPQARRFFVPRLGKVVLDAALQGRAVVPIRPVTAVRPHSHVPPPGSESAVLSSRPEASAIGVRHAPIASGQRSPSRAPQRTCYIHPRMRSVRQARSALRPISSDWPRSSRPPLRMRACSSSPGSSEPITGFPPACVSLRSRAARACTAAPAR